jgi:hypothetical protein
MVHDAHVSIDPWTILGRGEGNLSQDIAMEDRMCLQT